MGTHEFFAVVSQHQQAVLSYAVYLLGDHGEAEDVAQEAFVRLWRHRQVWRGRQARAWLARVTRNLCFDVLRKRKVVARIFVGPSADDTAATPEPGPEELAMSAQCSLQLRQAIEELSEQGRSVVILREVAGLSYQEIAEVMELPLAKVRATLHRARARLRAHLREVYEHVAAG